MKPQIGITPEHLMEVADLLTTILADEFLLYTKTLDAHWNVEGSDFHSKHLFFQRQYNELFEIIDKIAERTRSLGHYATATLSDYLEFTNLTESSGNRKDSTSFVKLLLEDHESIIVHLRERISLANELKDVGTSDFITGIMKAHEKMAWMLRAHVNDKLSDSH